MTLFVFAADDGTEVLITFWDDDVLSALGDRTVPDVATRPAGARSWGPPWRFVRREPALPRDRTPAKPDWDEPPLPGMDAVR